jgi:hypothetical protein
MTPKEKAQELVDKFKKINEDYIDNYQSIPCALIAVDELIQWLPSKEWDSDPTTIFDVEYWYEVKKEIELL